MSLGRDRAPIGSAPPGSVGVRASGHRPLLRGLHRAAHRSPADGHPPAAGQGRRLGVDPRRRPRLQAAELDEPALHAQGGAGRRRGHLDGHEQGRRAADHHHRGGRRTTTPTSSASTPACRRTASRRSCSGCWRCTWRPSAPAGRWCAASTRPRSGRSTCSAATPSGAVVAVEIKRRGEIDGVEQLTRYLELLNRDPLLAPVKGVFAAQEIKPQARVLAADRGIDCVDRRLRRPQGHRRPDPAPVLTGYRPVTPDGPTTARRSERLPAIAEAGGDGSVARELNEVGVVGLGTMGAGIVEVLAARGPVGHRRRDQRRGAGARPRPRRAVHRPRGQPRQARPGRPRRDLRADPVQHVAGGPRRPPSWSSRPCPSAWSSRPRSSPSWTRSARRTRSSPPTPRACRSPSSPSSPAGRARSSACTSSTRRRS